MIEIMPGVVPKALKILKQRLDIPIISGGLIDTKEEIIEALNAGAIAVSTSNKDLWYK
jgi:glycerol uptake operon antiterminator